MSFSELFQKRTGKVSFEALKNSKLFATEISGYDLFYQLTYMSAIAGGGITRDKLFELSAKLPPAPAQYFDTIYGLHKDLRYNYADACRTIGEPLHAERLRSLLLRLSDALTSGEPEEAFLAQEAKVQAGVYENEYERDLSSLTKWTDAYASIIISASLIVIINLISTMIYKMGTGLMAGLLLIAVATSTLGAWILSRSAPREIRSLFSTEEGPRYQRLARRLVKILPPIALVACALLVLLKVDLGWILIVASLIVLPLGIVSNMGDSRIDKKDKEIGSFLRSLGSMASTTSTTTTDALNRIDLSPFPSLRPEAEKLRRRLNAGVLTRLCWRKFRLELGSKLAYETVGIFRDAVDLGADPGTAGVLCSQFAERTITLRAKRKVTTAVFTWLTIIMHGTVGGLMIIILDVIDRFLTLLASAMPSGEEAVEAMSTMALSIPLLSFSTPEIRLLRIMTIGMVLLLTVTNAFAILAADGGHVLKISFYLSILLFVTGLGFIFLPPVIGNLMPT
jgi:flagellar protein FlaJ